VIYCSRPYAWLNVKEVREAEMLEQDIGLSNFLIRIIFLALPGIIASLLFRKLRGKPNQKDWEDFIEIWFYSVISYAIYGLVIEAYNWKTGSSHKLKITEAIFDEKNAISWKEIAAVSVVSIIVAIAASYLSVYRIPNKVGLWLRATRRCDDADVWAFVNDIYRSRWVIIRDHKLNLAYYGWIAFYSDSEKNRELLLRSVTAYNNLDWKVLYESEMLYISREKADLSIEIVPEYQVAQNSSATDEVKEINNVNRQPEQPSK
jgi:Family of unknown function (DUF6338)